MLGPITKVTTLPVQRSRARNIGIRHLKVHKTKASLLRTLVTAASTVAGAQKVHLSRHPFLF